MKFEGEGPVYTYEVRDQMGLLCFRIQSWRKISPEWFKAILPLGADDIALEFVYVTGGGEDGTRYVLYGGMVYGHWELDPETKPREDLRIIE